MNKKWWFKAQRGQALTEYWATIPAGIIIMLAAGGLTQFIIKTILTTTEVFQPTGGVSECDIVEEDKDEGPEYAQLDCHSVQLVGRSYDEESDQTTVAYKVTSACDPDISHWMLGVPASVASRILSSSEKYEYVTDPTTGVTGVKFDTEYGGGGGKDKKKSADAISLVDYSRAPTAVDSRVVILTMGGYFTWDIVEVGVKYGTETIINVITAPVAPATPEDEDDECAM